MVGAKEGKLGPDENLVIIGFVIKADGEEPAGRVPKVVDGIVATWD